MAKRNPVQQRNTLGKLSPPRLGLVFGRARLFALLDAYAQQPGIWIAGPPGIGKTTLVATYLAEHPAHELWLQLDTADADPATFVYFLNAAIPVAAGHPSTPLPLPAADDLRDVPGFVRRCFRRLSETLEPPWTLVLDNAQELGNASPLYAGLAAALTELPQHARIVIISRNPPPAEFARALTAQQIGVIDAQAMHFSLEETQALVKLHGKECEASALLDATDGWAAAMILLLAARGNVVPGRAVQGGAVRARLFDFFAGEVMAKLQPSQAAALERIAFLPSATEAMANTISGNAHAGQLLAELARRSLFTDRREEAQPTYTFHALFGEFLRSRALASLSPDALQALRAKAADLLATGGHVDMAIAQLLQAQLWDDALQLVNAHASRFVSQGRTASVKGWILALPDAYRLQPATLYWLGYCELAVNPADALRYLQAAHAGFAAAGDVLGSLWAASAAADAIVFIGSRLDVLDPWIKILSQHAPTYLAQRDVETDLRVMPGLLAAFVYREAQHPLTAQLADIAETLLDQAMGASQRILLASLAYYLLWTGQIVRLDRIMIKIDRMCADGDAATATLLRWYGTGVLVRSLLGRIDEALADGRSALGVAQGNKLLTTKAHLLMVLAAEAARDGELAQSHLTEAASLLDPANAIDATTYEFQCGILALLKRDWPQALRLMRVAVASGRDSGWPLREHIALLGQTLAATEAGDFVQAENTLKTVFAHRFYAVCVWHHWLTGLIEANLAYRQGDARRCASALLRAFTVGRQYGYDFGPMPYCCGDLMSRLTCFAIEHDIDAPFAVGLIRRYQLAAPLNAGEHWPWPIRIYTLGRFALDHCGAPPTLSRKESRKPLDLLKLTIALGGVAVPIDRLAQILWPDAEGDAARNSLDNALHRLRKLVGGDAHIQLRAGSLSINPATCWVDVLALQACWALPTGTELADGDTLAATIARALALYQGAFMPGEDDYPQVLAARSQIQTRFIRQMGALGAKLETAGRWEQAAQAYRRVVELEPLAEDIYRRLMACLMQLGQRAEAFEAYRRCRSQLSIVLGIQPSANTEALAAVIRID